MLEARSYDPAIGQRGVKFRAIHHRLFGKRPVQKRLTQGPRTLKIEALPFPLPLPNQSFPIEDMYTSWFGANCAPKGFTHVHHFFTACGAGYGPSLGRRRNAS